MCSEIQIPGESFFTNVLLPMSDVVTNKDMDRKITLCEFEKVYQYNQKR